MVFGLMKMNQQVSAQAIVKNLKESTTQSKTKLAMFQEKET